VSTEPEPQAAAPAKSKAPWWVYVVVLAVFVTCGLLISRSNNHEPTTTENRDDAVRVCKEKFIPDRLKAPATAKFSNITTTDNAGTYTVTGSVDSENSFGALIRSTFICSVHSSGNQWVLDSATVG